MATVTNDNLRTRLRSHLGLSTTDTTSLSDADASRINNEAKRTVQEDIDMWWTEKNTTFSTVAGTIPYALSTIASDWRKPLHIWFMSGESTYRLAKINRAKEIRAYPPTSGETRNKPNAWYRFGVNVRLRPAPDAVYTMQLDYMAYLADLSATGDNDDITNNAPNLILAKATARALRELYGAYDDARYYDDVVYVEELRRWREHHSREAISGMSIGTKIPHQIRPRRVFYGREA